MKAKLLIKFVGIVVFIILFSMIDFDKLWSIIGRMKIIKIIPIFGLVLVTLLVKALRWKFILDKQLIKISFKQNLKFYLSGIYIGLLTPGRIGEFGKIISL